MRDYSGFEATEELCGLGSELLEKACRLAQEKDSYELARMLVILDKEVYRFEEVARKLRLTGELDIDVYKELISGYGKIRQRIFGPITEHKLNNEVARLFKIMRFSNEVAGLYLTEYLREIREVGV